MLFRIIEALKGDLLNLPFRWLPDRVVQITLLAFGEVKDAFSVFLYNWTRITELRSIHKRLMEFETAINYNKKSLRKPRKSDVRA